MFVIFINIQLCWLIPEFKLMVNCALQFLVYGGYFLVLGIVFGCIAVYTLCSKEMHKQKLWLPKEIVTSESQT